MRRLDEMRNNRERNMRKGCSNQPARQNRRCSLLPKCDVPAVRNSVARTQQLERSEDRVVCPSDHMIVANWLDAGFRFVGPFQLDDVTAESFGFPCADVADFSVRIVIPASTGDGIGDGFTKFVRGSGGERVRNCETSFASCAAGIGHDGIKNIAAGGVMVAAKSVTGFGAPLTDLRTARKENEVERIGSVRRKRT